MEKKIGEVFTDGKNKIKVFESTDDDCKGCFYDVDVCGADCTKNIHVAGFCGELSRNDQTGVIFKIEK
ncbi:MAG: hypothetical protein NTX38_01000 [Methylobacter sp.]|nr:hypothetical protein [Methylobacter sp.]